MSKQSLWTKNFNLICISNFFQFMTFYLLLSTLPAFVLNVIRDGEQEAGLAVSAFMVSALIIRPLAGKWIDKLDRRKILLLSLGVYFIISLCFFGAHSLGFIVAVRFLQGGAFAVVNTVTATLAAEIIPAERKGEGIGYFATCMSLAVAMGPFLGLSIIANTNNFTVLFTAVAGLSFLAGVTAVFIKVPKRSPASIAAATVTSTSNWLQYFEPSAARGGIVSMCILFSFSGVATFVSVYAQQLGMGELARYFYVIYAVMVVVSRPFAGRTLDKLGPNVVIYPAIVLFGLAIIILSQVHSPIVFLAVGAIVGIGFGSLFSSLQTIAVATTPDSRKGLATATFFFLGDFGMGMGPFILGAIVAWTNYSIMYLVSAMVVILSIGVYYLLGRLTLAK
ncbi:MAG: pbuE 1 [Firmicutes bacterium]|nr:pbuE 1 [Bacillota bacterium]